MGGAIYIDDSGNPGNESGSVHLPLDRKSWTAVIVPSIVADDVEKAMSIFLQGVKDDYNASELHFTDIWSGNGVWKQVDAKKRAEMFQLMAEVMHSFALPIVHQTISAQALRDHQNMFVQLQKTKIEGWNLDDISQYCLLFLCSRIFHHTQEMRAVAPNEIEVPMNMYVDEGILSAGQSRKLPIWSEVIRGPEVKFSDSKSIPGLQLADFAAFVITRTQWISVTRTPQDRFQPAEEVILKACEKLNVLNLPLVRTDSPSLHRASYDKFQNADRMRKGLPALNSAPDLEPGSE